MGLDQQAYAIKGDKSVEIAVWRKHANLEGWMAELYKSRGGTRVFNCIDLKLEKADILKLEEEYLHLRSASGFFWGNSTELDNRKTKEFIDKAKSYLCDGYEIIYSSWW